MYDRVYFDTAFLLSSPGMTSNTLENGIGEQGDCGRIYDFKLFYSLLCTVSPAVRGKQILIGRIQIAIYFFKELL